jgi:catechol 2,3-dioxygenase-like lactoylglutathione lyase family enzyme
MQTDGESTLRGVHHIGATVADLDRALAFWETFLGTEALWRRTLDSPYLSDVVGYPDARINGAFVQLPGEVFLELLEYQMGDREPNDMATSRPGNVHICLQTEDPAVDFARAIAAGATPVSGAPVRIMSGPNVGASACYLRIPDGITIELFQKPRA